MKMKKNTAFNHNTEHRAADTVLVIFSLIVISVFIFLIYKNLNKTFKRTDKAPAVAVIIYKQNIVQRKLVDRAVWDRPVKSSLIYNGDTLRTDEDASAEIRFLDESASIDLGADTMIQIFKPISKKEGSVFVKTGKVSVYTADSEITVNSGNSFFKAKHNSILHTEKKENGFSSFAVEKGGADKLESAENGEKNKTGELYEGLTFSETEGNLQGSPLVMIQPSYSARVFNRDAEGKPFKTVFKWESAFSENEKLIFEISSSPKFKKSVKSFDVTGKNEFALEKEDGIFYWRLYALAKGAEDESSVSGRMEIVPASDPVIIQPALNSVYTYKNEFPRIPFIWKGNKTAVSYIIEIADNGKMENPKIRKTVIAESVSISELGAGKWFWRVTPNYAYEIYGDKREYEVSSFSVERRDKESEIKLVAPQEAADTSDGKTLRFSWKNMQEADKYRLRISNDTGQKDVVFEKVVSTNYFELADSSDIFSEGNYYWSVQGLDKTGAVAGASEVHKFKALDGGIVLRPVFPPDGYTVSENLCGDMRFTWKTNLENSFRLQVSSSKNFSSVFSEVKTSSTGISGIKLKAGQWYWRVVTNLNGQEIKSEPKKLISAPVLPKPELINAEKNIVIVPGKKISFKWKKVYGADYYRVKIRENKPDAEPFFEEPYFTETEMETSFEHVEEGGYIISIQGFTESSRNSSRFYGLTENHYFKCVHLKPVELLYPENGARLNGRQAALNPGVLKWKSVENPTSFELILERAGEVVFKVKNPSGTVKLPPLSAGKYRWRITAFTKNGFDISSKKDFAFTVLPVSPLNAVNFLFPEQNGILDVAFFKDNGSIYFSWNRAGEATHYSVRIYKEGGKTVFKKEIPSSSGGRKITMEFKELSLLSRGTFFIEVKALHRLNDGKLFRGGKVSVRKFIIDLPKAKKVTTDETGVMYGA